MGGMLFGMMGGGANDPDRMMLGGCRTSSGPRSALRQDDALVQEKVWLNIRGHVVNNTPGKNNSEVCLAAIEGMLDKLIRPGSIFVLSQRNNQLQRLYESTDPDTTITSFELSLEMNSPINVVSRRKR